MSPVENHWGSRKGEVGNLRWRASVFECSFAAATQRQSNMRQSSETLQTKYGSYARSNEVWVQITTLLV